MVGQTSPRVHETRRTLKSVRQRRQQVRDAMVELEMACSGAIGAEGWQDTLLRSLNELHRVFVEYVADGNDVNGALQQVVLVRPDLAADVRRLQADQARLIEDMAALERRMGVVENATLRSDVVHALVALSRCRQSSADLFFACYSIDVGASAKR